MINRLALALSVVISLAALACSCNRSSSSGTSGAAPSASPGIDPTGVAVGAERREQAAAVVRTAFQLQPGQEALAPLLFVGSGEAAIARDSRTGVCAIVYESTAGGFGLYKLQKGGALDTEHLMLNTRGTMQGTATARDLEMTYKTRCH